MRCVCILIVLITVGCTNTSIILSVDNKDHLNSARAIELWQPPNTKQNTTKSLPSILLKHKFEY